MRKFLIIFVFVHFISCITNISHAESEDIYVTLAEKFKKSVEQEDYKFKNMKFKEDLESAKKYKKRTLGEHRKFFLRGDDEKLYMLKEEKHRLRILQEVLIYKIFKLFANDPIVRREINVNIDGQKKYGTLLEFKEGAKRLKIKDLDRVTPEVLKSIARFDILEYLIAEVWEDDVIYIAEGEKVVDVFFVDHDALASMHDLLGGIEREYRFTEVYEYVFLLYRNEKEYFDIEDGMRFASFVSKCPDNLIVDIFKPYLEEYEKEIGSQIFDLVKASWYLRMDQSPIEDVKHLLIAGGTPYFIREGKEYFKQADVAKCYLELYLKEILWRKNNLLEIYKKALKEELGYSMDSLKGN